MKDFGLIYISNVFLAPDNINTFCRKRIPPCRGRVIFLLFTKPKWQPVGRHFLTASVAPCFELPSSVSALSLGKFELARCSATCTICNATCSCRLYLQIAICSWPLGTGKCQSQIQDMIAIICLKMFLFHASMECTEPESSTEKSLE